MFDRYYADAGEPLVLLTIDTDRLEVPWREDARRATTPTRTSTARSRPTP